jgi:decaprenylphospho-beta-D-erythro-pentofuranosid-2-ulose 2-reductase
MRPMSSKEVGASSRSMERVLVFGATSAIAVEVAMLHARRGARLHLIGRDPQKLAAAAASCACETAAKVTTASADFDDMAANEGLVAAAVAELGGVDSVLIAHGYLGDQLETERSFDAAEKTLRTNFLSVVSLLVPLANHLEAQGRGRLGVITSVAGDRGRPRNYTYGAAKGALNIYLQGLRTRLYASGVTVTTLKLGPVDSPMTKDHKKHLLFGQPARVARGIVHAMDAGTPEAYVPSFWSAIMPVVKNTPERVFQKLSFLSGR